ncbi:hypothetical protein ABK040_006386 [Willaertia magna]
MFEAYIGLGTNLGNRIHNIQKALDILSGRLSNPSSPFIMNNNNNSHDVLPGSNNNNHNNQNKLIEIIDTSFLYLSSPQYITEQPIYLNAVCKIKTNLQPNELLIKLQSIEKQLGRRRDYLNNNNNGNSTINVKYGPRIIDLDILFYGDEIIGSLNEKNELKTETNHELIVPHPKLFERDFVLKPLMDICPDKIHPIFKKTIRELYENLQKFNKKGIFKVLPFSSFNNNNNIRTDNIDNINNNNCDIFDDNYFFPFSNDSTRTLLMGVINVTPDSFSEQQDENSSLLLSDNNNTINTNNITEMNITGKVLLENPKLIINRIVQYINEMNIENPPMFLFDNNISDNYTISNYKKFNNKEGLKSPSFIIDIGAQSTRPNATLLSPEEEWLRLKPILEEIQSSSFLLELMKEKHILISIDTFYSLVAENSIKCLLGFVPLLINDVSGGLMDEKIFEVCSRYRIPIVITHMRGTPQTMTNLKDYIVVKDSSSNNNSKDHDDGSSNVKANTNIKEGVVKEDEGVVREVVDEKEVNKEEEQFLQVLSEEIQDRIRIAIDKYHLFRWQIILDPGIGFAKGMFHNLILLRKGRIELNKRLHYDYPMLFGFSRKGFISKILHEDNDTKKKKKNSLLFGNAACLTCSIQQGVDIVRVHDIKEMNQVALLSDAIYKNNNNLL